MKYSLVCSFLALLLASLPEHGRSATPPGRDQGLLLLQALDQRIADVSWRIASANTELCPQRMEAIGVSVHNAVQYAQTYRQAATDTFGFGDGLPAVLAVAKGSPASTAGILPGDRIVSFDGEAIPPARPTPRAREDYSPIDAVMKRLEILSTQPVTIEIIRGDRRMDLAVKPATICRSRVEVVPGSQINANSNGAVVQIYGKLALWVRTDDELATIIAHEMAHNILGHNARIERERIGTGVSAVFGSSGAKLREMEREADRYGLFLIARAGYDYRSAPDFWRRLTNTTGLGGIWATTHPAARDRAAFNQTVVAEMDRKRLSGGPLTP